MKSLVYILLFFTIFGIASSQLFFTLGSPNFTAVENTFTNNLLKTGNSFFSIPSVPANNFMCRDSVTRINGGQKVCTNTLVFEEHFTSPNANLNNWIIQQYIPREPDYEFNTYEISQKNCYLRYRHLNLKPTLRDDPFITTLDLSDGCNGEICKLNAIGTLLPPIVSAQLKSKFSFLYGRIELKVQLPRGMWIFPQLYLEPKNYDYGNGYKSGRFWLAYARGNRNLQNSNTSEEIGNRVLYIGPVLSSTEPTRSNSAIAIEARRGYIWADDFHIFSITWSPAGFSVEIDGREYGDIRPPFQHPENNELWTSKMAPFDKEFVITLGVGVGGHSDFPDDTVSEGRKKPWKKTNSKATALFNNDKDNWYDTWGGENTALKIDYVKVWSL